MAETANEKSKILEIAQRIHELRDITGFTTAEMAGKTEVTEENYLNYEAGKLDFPFTFIHKCALAFGVEITDLLEGHSARLSSYTVTRKGRGQTTATEEGITIQNLAPMFRKKLAEPYWVRYEYSDELQKKPIHTTTHSGQEFDLVISGTLLVQVGGHKELLHEGDSIFYNSSTPHGMIAVDGKDCVFLAMVIASEDGFKPFADHHIIKEFTPADHRNLVCEKFIHPVEDENGCLKDISFTDADKFNFAFDIVDEIARLHPDKTAMVHVSADKTERIFTFKDIKQKSAQAANYFKSLGIKKGDRVMLVMKRHYQFWFAILGLHKLGAIVVPATNLLVEHDFDYRFNAGGISAIVCTADGDTAHQVDLAHKNSPTLKTKIIVNGEREGWHNFDKEFVLFSRKFERTADSACGGDPMLMFFTSGTTGYPKIATHNFKYPLRQTSSQRCARQPRHASVTS